MQTGNDKVGSCCRELVSLNMLQGLFTANGASCVAARWRYCVGKGAGRRYALSQHLLSAVYCVAKGLNYDLFVAAADCSYRVRAG